MAVPRIPRLLPERDNLMMNHPPGQAQPDAGHAQPIDPILDPPQPTDAGHQLQDVLPQIQNLSQQVGGMDNLSEIIDSIKTFKE